MTITFTLDDDFYGGIEQLVKRGLTFHADYNKMTITLLGGY